MTGSPREVEESPVFQGEDEEISYQFDFTKWGTPGSPGVTLLDLTTGMDESEEKLNGAASADGNIVTSPKVFGLTAGHRYRLECLATISSNRLGMYLVIEAE